MTEVDSLPDVWADVVGQPAAVATLQRAATHPESMTHAWLVTGPPGSGRSVAARAFAASLIGDGDPSAAGRVLRGTHPDLTVVATDKTVITVAEVRELVTLGQRSPAEAPWRVLIIEDADRIAERSANALLKAIEEPPPRTVWVLCAPSEQDVITTIRSRCRHVGLRVPSTQAVADLLVRRHEIEPEVARRAASAAQSHIGLARGLALSPEARERRNRVLGLATGLRGVGEAVLAAAELVEIATAQGKAVAEERDAVERAELMRSLGADGEGGTLPPAIRSQIRQLEDDQKRRAKRAVVDGLDRALTDLLSFYRDVLVAQSGSGVDLVNQDLSDRVGEVADASTAEQTLARIDAISTARTRLVGNVAPLLAIEAMMVALRQQAREE